jgi:serine/threonine protein kinase
LSGSSEDEKEDPAHLEHSLRRSTQIVRADAIEDKPAPTKPEPGVPSNFVVTYFGDELGPGNQGPSEIPLHTMTSSLFVSQSSILQTSSSQSSLSPLMSTSSVGVDVPIIKWGELEVGELLGSGAFGTVHAGRWRGAPVAIKRLHVAPDNPMEFMHEAAMMRKMSHHPNIIRLFGICDDPTNFAIISQLCSNGSLHDILSKRPAGEIPWHRIVGIARDAAAGAYHLHCENLIHRDLACRNILVTENWTGVISDFGLSRVLENQNKSHRTATMSAVRWAAPECLKDEKYSSKSDVWSFGMCLVEILTRGPPFPNLSYAEILRAVYTDRALPIELPVDADLILKDLVSSCCKQSPDDRIDFKDIYAILDKHYKALVANSNK